MTMLSLITITIICLYFQTILTNSTITKPQKIVTRLIHRDSVPHPKYNPNDTVLERTRRLVELSESRIGCFENSRDNFCPAPNHNIMTGLEAVEIGFLVEFGIGEPSVTQFAIVDSGSALAWVQCAPCSDCFNQSYPMFEPNRSSTYHVQPCISPKCDLVSFHMPCHSPTDPCHYSQSYADESYTVGVLATEQFTFHTVQGATLLVPNLTFGCGGSNLVTSKNYSVFGLSSSPLSIAAQLGDMFSYCIGSVTDPDYSYNTLSFGYGIDAEGDATPFEAVDGRFYVTLEGISVGGKRLKIDSEVFRRTGSGGGTFLDSGATLTVVVKEAYEALRREVVRLAKGVLKKVPDRKGRRRLCFYGVADRDGVGFPVVTFHFAGGAELALDPTSLFRQMRGESFCMTVDSAEDYHLLSDYDYGFDYPFDSDPVSIIGVWAQQDYNVVYDMAGHNIYFQRIDCELLMDT